MQAASVCVEHQKVHVVVDPQTQQISGETDINFVATPNPQPPVVFLNARQMNVTAVSVNGQPAKFTFIDSHKALDLQHERDGYVVRDAAYFASVCRVVLESPDLVIELGGAELPVTVHVEFVVNQDSTAILRDNDSIFTDNWANGASSWFPCIDTPAQRSMFTLSVTHNEEFIAVGPGEASQQPVDPETRMKTVVFRIPFPVTPSAVGFSLARFSHEKLENTESTIYFLDNRDTFKNTMKAMPDIMNKTLQLFKYVEEDPYQSLSFVSLPFLPDLRVFPGVCFIPPHMMLPAGNINVIPTVIPLLVEAVVSQYIMFLVPVESVDKEWWQTGLILYFSDLIVSEFYSKSSFLDRRWDDINFLYVEDIHPAIVLKSIDPTTGEPYRDQYLRIKAKLLVNMIVQSSQRGSWSITEWLKETLRCSEEFSGFWCGIDDVFAQCPSINKRDFERQWLGGAGMPIFEYGYKRDSRGKNAKVVIYQRSSLPPRKSERSDSKSDAPRLYTGKMAVQLLDIQRPVEKHVTIEKVMHMFTLECFAKKYKRKKIEFKLQGLRDPVSVKVHDALIWIILDPNSAWICRVRGRVPEYMLGYQLDLRRDAFAQHEVIGEMEEFSHTVQSRDKLEMLMDGKEYWWGVRCHAARALARFNSNERGDENASALIKWYKKNFYTQGLEGRPKPHDFHDVPKHYVQLEVIKSLSVIRQPDNKTPRAIVEMFFQLLTCTNTKNMYNDEAFQAEVELALGRVIYQDDDKCYRAWKEVESKIHLYSTNTRVELSVVTTAGYEALTAMAWKHLGMANNVGKEQVQTLITRMRTIVFQHTPYCEAKERLFRCLLYLALYSERRDLSVCDFSFRHIISDIKRLVGAGKYRTAAAYIRCVYRFLFNSATTSTEDRFKSYLLAIPADVKRSTLRHMIGGRDTADVAETLWVIMTRYGKSHKMLRSETFRLYTTLYGTSTPRPYQRNRSSDVSTQVYDSHLVFERRKLGEFTGVILEGRERDSGDRPKPSFLRPNLPAFPDPPRVSDKRSDRDRSSPPRIPASRSYETTPEERLSMNRGERSGHTPQRPVERPRNPVFGASALWPDEERKPFHDQAKDRPGDVPKPQQRPRDTHGMPRDMSFQPLTPSGGSGQGRWEERQKEEQRKEEIPSTEAEVQGNVATARGFGGKGPAGLGERAKEEQRRDARESEVQSKPTSTRPFGLSGKGPGRRDDKMKEETRSTESEIQSKPTSARPFEVSGKGVPRRDEKPKEEIRSTESEAPNKPTTARPFEVSGKGPGRRDEKMKEETRSTESEIQSKSTAARPFEVSGKGVPRRDEKPKEEQKQEESRSKESENQQKSTQKPLGISGKGPWRLDQKPKDEPRKEEPRSTESEIPNKPTTARPFEVSGKGQPRRDDKPKEETRSTESEIQSKPTSARPFEVSGKGLPRREEKPKEETRSTESEIPNKPTTARPFGISGKGQPRRDEKPKEETISTESDAPAKPKITKSFGISGKGPIRHDEKPKDEPTESEIPSKQTTPKPIGISGKGPARRDERESTTAKPLGISGKGPGRRDQTRKEEQTQSTESNTQSVKPLGISRKGPRSTKDDKVTLSYSYEPLTHVSNDEKPKHSRPSNESETKQEYIDPIPRPPRQLGISGKGPRREKPSPDAKPKEQSSIKIAAKGPRLPPKQEQSQPEQKEEPKTHRTANPPKPSHMHTSQSAAPIVPSRKSDDFKDKGRRDYERDRDRDRDYERIPKDWSRSKDRDRGRDRDRSYRSDRDRDKRRRERSYERDEPIRSRDYEMD